MKVTKDLLCARGFRGKEVKTLLSGLASQDTLNKHYAQKCHIIKTQWAMRPRVKEQVYLLQGARDDIWMRQKLS